MTPQEALQIVAQACAEFRGTLKDHEILQQALNVLRKAIEKAEEDAKTLSEIA